MENKIIKKESPRVNCIYSLAMIVEGLALDCNDTNAHEQAVAMRSKIVKGSAESFGDWSDGMESYVLKLPFHKETILHACIELIYQLSRKVEAGFRKVDASFDFYQRNEIAAMRPKEVNNTCYRALRHLIYERYIK